MLFQNYGAMPNPSRSKAGDFSLTPRGRGDSCCSKCCKIFWIAFTLTGFLLCITIGITLGITGQGTKMLVAGFIFSAVFCLFVCITLIRRKDNHPIRVSLPKGSIDEIYEHFVYKSQSDSVLINVPGRAESTLSLPIYILLPSSQRPMVVESRASTVLTMSEETSRKTLDEEAAGSSNEKGDVAPSAGEELGKSTETIVKVVDETLHGKGGAEAAGEGSSGISEESRKVVQQGVRQRKQTPMETQTHVPAPEGEKTE